MEKKRSKMKKEGRGAVRNGGAGVRAINLNHIVRKVHVSDWIITVAPNSIFN